MTANDCDKLLNHRDTKDHKPKFLHVSFQSTLTRSSSSAAGYLRTSISVPRLPQQHGGGGDKQKLRTSVSAPRLPQHHAAPPPPAPAPASAAAGGAGGSASVKPATSPAVMNLQAQHNHSHSLDELHSGRDGLNRDREVLLWVYTETTKLYLFSTPESDALVSVHDFLHRTQKLNPSEYELAILTPGLLYPVLLQNFKADLHAGVLLCLPATDLHISIQTQEREVFSVQAHPLDTIEDIKLRIQDVKGYPTVIQDLTLDGHILRNQDSVMDYHMSQETRLFLILQPCKKFPINVDTFWGIKHTIEVGACTLVRHIIQTILRKTMRAEEEASDFHARIFTKNKPIYDGLIRLESNNEVMKENLCLGFYRVSRGATLRLNSVGEGNQDNLRMIQVLLENGVTVHTNAAKYDNWYIVVLKLHGITGKPVDTMRVHVNENPVELSCTVSTLKQNGDVTYAKLATLRTSNSVANLPNTTSNSSLQIEVKSLNGVSETVQCSAQDTIHDLKLKLERARVPEARYCDVLYKKVKLPTSSKLQDYKLQARTQMELKMGEFPVRVMWATNTFQLTAQSVQPISDLLSKIEAQTGANAIKSAVLFAGKNLYDIEDLVIQACTLYVHSTLYVEPLQPTRVLHLVTVDDVMPIPIRPNIDSLHLHQLSHLHLHPDVFLKLLHWFIKWRFPTKKNSSHRSSHSHSEGSSGSGSNAFVQRQPRSLGRGGENASLSRSVVGGVGSQGSPSSELRSTKPRRILDQRSRTMPILSLQPRDVNQNPHIQSHQGHTANHPHMRQSFDFSDLNNSPRDSSLSVVQIRNKSMDKRDRSLDRLTTVVNIRENSPKRRERSLDRSNDRSAEASSALSAELDPQRPGGAVTVYLPNMMHSNSDELSSSLTPSSSNSSPSSIKSASGVVGSASGYYNGFPPSRSEAFPNRRPHRQLPMLPNDMSPSSTPDSTPASKKKLQVRFELPTTENGGSNGDTWDKNTTPVKSALKKGSSKLQASGKTPPNYGMTISTRAHSVDSTDFTDTKPPQQWNQMPRSKTVVEYYTDHNSN